MPGVPSWNRYNTVMLRAAKSGSRPIEDISAGLNSPRHKPAPGATGIQTRIRRFVRGKAALCILKQATVARLSAVQAHTFYDRTLEVIFDFTILT